MIRKPTVIVLPFTGKQVRRRGPTKKIYTSPQTPSMPKQEYADKNAVDPDNHRLVWQETFGARLVICDRLGLLLDGKPITYHNLMRLTKLVRKKNGLPLLGKHWALW